MRDDEEEKKGKKATKNMKRTDTPWGGRKRETKGGKAHWVHIIIEKAGNHMKKHANKKKKRFQKDGKNTLTLTPNAHPLQHYGVICSSKQVHIGG